ncbi:MAG: (p)ppGpp synthetase SpoT/RelA, partial [Polaromonas sp.]|nr:(p)ppGpp synthetase SpoT/RelA [Polaromonas sp.]
SVHTDDCVLAKRLQQRDAERFIAVDWSDEATRTFETNLLVTVSNGKGVLAKVASALANAEVDITHVDMGNEPANGVIDLRFSVAVRDRVHLAAAMRNVKRTVSVLRVHRIKAPN